ncbi:hypothetical protein LTR95_000850 [Oleoguttula sp. CCFEE 5521]
MSEPIILRNLTAQPLTLKSVERFEAPNAQNFQPNVGFSISNITSRFNGSDSKPPELSPSFTTQDVDIRVEPFTTRRTDIKAFERGPDEILRLTFQGDGGGRWRIDTPSRTTASQNLTPLTPDPRHDYTGIYIKDTSFLALYESVDLQRWMSHMGDQTPLSGLSIPGTHNSPTYHNALPSVRCQAVSPTEQMKNGVRFFDIRVQSGNPEDPNSDSLSLVHGVFPISLTGPKKFRDLLDKILQFLAENPTETMILSLKREGPGNATDAQLSDTLKNHYTNPEHWYTEPRIPSLGEVRGRIVLVRRFSLADRLKGEWQGRGWCLNAENWAYNTPNCSYGDVCVQDFCEVMETENIDRKIQLCCEHFERAAEVCCPEANAAPLPPFYLNFLSASNFWKVGCWPDKIAEKLNPAVTRFMCEKHDIGDRGIEEPGAKVNGDGSVGIVVCDWVGKDGDWDLVKCIVGMNARILLRQKGVGWR